jgi:FKBP-type peptidyl-prolyl cis-trans isomerase SlyD
MRIRKNRVVIIDYVLRDDAGSILDQSTDATFAYLHGAGNLIRGLERALEGRQAGDRIAIDVEPASGYGEHRAADVRRLPRTAFPADTQLEIGAQYRDGSGRPFAIVALDGDQVVIDTNHPLAGKRLHFEVAVVSVRGATHEERAHGHVHGPGGHAH